MSDEQQQRDDYAVVESDEVFRGHVIGLRRDTVRMPDGSTSVREVVEHPGAVAIVALYSTDDTDDADEVVLVNQYRHPVRARLDELPAGLLDVEGESALDGARRELVEEAGLVADRWDVLLDLQTSPGFSDEAIRVFLARGLHDSNGKDGFVPEHEELAMTVSRVPLDEAVRRASTGRITNAAAVAGLLAAAHGRATGWRDLRPAGTPWSARPGR